MSRLSQPLRTNKVGLTLCAAAQSALPADCYFNLTSIKLSSSQGGRQQIAEHIVNFCSVVDDPLPYLCAAQALQRTSITLDKALLICQDSIDNDITRAAVPHCIEQMSQYVSSALPAEKMVQFCVHINPTIYPITASDNQTHATSIHASVECFEESSLKLNKMQALHRLQLCENAPEATGPLGCASHILTSTSTIKPKSEEVASLCQGAWDDGPALCFVESKAAAGTVAERVQLCNGARNAGPAHCYRRSAGLLKDTRDRLLLCVGASSEAPALCAASAPSYLSPEEKIQLCQHASPDTYLHPSRCLQAVQPLSPRFAQSPKKGLGYGLEIVTNARDRASRGLLVQLCSFSDSMDPTASAECFKSVPASIPHDQAALMCRNISSTELIDSLLFCYRLLPAMWTTPSPQPSNTHNNNTIPLPPAHTLCALKSRTEVEKVVKCAVEGIKLIPPATATSHSSLGIQDIAKVCQTEREKELFSLACLSQSLQHSRSSSSPVPAATIVKVCANSHSRYNAQCLADLAKWAGEKGVGLHHTVIEQVCSTPANNATNAYLDASFYIQCFGALFSRNKHFGEAELAHCHASPRSITRAEARRVERVFDDDDDAEAQDHRIVAGGRFHLVFDLFDQFDRPFGGVAGVPIHITLLPSPQGAVLWGAGVNTSHPRGSLTFHNLAVSQPGEVEFKLTLLDGSKKVIGGGRLRVHTHPKWGDASPCLYIFHTPVCPADPTPEEQELAYPRAVTAIYAPSMYLQHLVCISTLPSWGVKGAGPLPSGYMVLEFRGGLEALWTGGGMVRAEDPVWTRLGLTEDDIGGVYEEGSSGQKATKKQLQSVLKVVKKAYYRLSLQWHPDRWVGYEMYLGAVKGAFQLVTEAYEELTGKISARLKEVEKEEVVVVEVFE
eukprot:gene25127-30344_t